MLLKGKNAVVYGGGGAIGGAVARGFAREGARVFLAGRTLSTLEPIAKEIGAERAVVDALDGAQVDAHADTIGRIDISFNAITHNDVQGTPMAEMDVEDYLAPVLAAVRTNVLTWQAAARHGASVILNFGGAGDPPRGAHLGGLQTAFHAIEAMRRQFSTETGHSRRHAAHRRRARVDPARLRRPRRDRREPRSGDAERPLRDARGRRRRRRVRRLRQGADDDRGDGERQRRRAVRLGRRPSVDVSPRWPSFSGLSIE